MITKTTFLIFYLLLFNIFCVKAQSKQLVKRDTIYYLLDTAKISKNERIIQIIPDTPNNSYYTYLINTRCMVGHSDPSLMSVHRDKGQLISKKDLKQIYFVSIVYLNNLLCKEMEKFPSNHQLYFIEHMPNGSYIKRKIVFGGMQVAIE